MSKIKEFFKKKVEIPLWREVLYTLLSLFLITMTVLKFIYG